jgi:hypothetical protein
MLNFDVVGTLAFFTIGTVLVLAIISWMRAKKAKAEHKDAAVAQRQRIEDGEPRRDGNTTMRDSGPTTADRAGEADSGRTWSHERGANPPTPVTPPD